MTLMLVVVTLMLVVVTLMLAVVTLMLVVVTLMLAVVINKILVKELTRYNIEKLLTIVKTGMGIY